MSDQCDIRTAQLTVEWTGIPRRADTVAETHNGIRVQVRWLDEHGHEINPATLKQGMEFYAHYRVRLDKDLGTLEEVVLTQLLPTGWEIENTRLNGGELPDWTRSFPLGTTEYTDIRDDRVSWFFDLHSWQKNDFHLIQKLRTVTRGTSQLPPTICEAMYNNEYRSVIPGRTVTVSSNK